MYDLRYLTIGALLGLLSLSSPVLSEPKQPVPEEIPGTVRVDAETLLQLAEQVPDLLLIDSRIAVDRQQGYIQGSISLPDEETDCITLSMHIPRKDSPTLFYCNGVKCGRSVVAIERAKTCGYTHLYWFRGGFEEWKNKQYPYLKE